MLSAQNQATVEAVESLIQYKFRNSALLWEALHIIGPSGASRDGNKRLALIGDSVLSLSLAEDWYRGTTNRGHWASSFQKGVGSNANLNLRGRALGLDRFIVGSTDGKHVADTVEAILGAIYLDTGNDMAKCKDVMDALELLPREQRLERELEFEGFVIIDDPKIELRQSKKRPSPDSGEEVHRWKRPTQQLL